MLFDGWNSDAAAATNQEQLLLDDWGIIILAIHLKNHLTLKELN